MKRNVGANMIPSFDEHGYLPPGIHPATLAEVEARFGQSSELRRVQMQSLGWLVDLARRASVQKIIINGSFVTDIIEPNDVDCLLVPGPSFSTDPAIMKELSEGLPFLEMELARETERAYEEMFRLFSSDRDRVPKGMIEIIP